MGKYGIPNEYEDFVAGQRRRIENDDAHAHGFYLSGADTSLWQLKPLLRGQLNVEIEVIDLPDIVRASSKIVRVAILQPPSSRDGYLITQGLTHSGTKFSFSLKGDSCYHWTRAALQLACPGCLHEFFTLGGDEFKEAINNACWQIDVRKLHIEKKAGLFTHEFSGDDPAGNRVWGRVLPDVSIVPFDNGPLQKIENGRLRH